MPGIAGIISRRSHENNLIDLHLMIHSIMHEPFYNSGKYINEDLALYVGWISHKDSFSDCMPVFNEKKDLILFFAGENFADKQVTNELKEKGHTFDDSNASYLIHLYEEDERWFLERLNGWFSGILVDLRKEKVVLFNDRYGMNRIYYYEEKEEFLFSSEAKSLLKVRPELRSIDLESLGQFFSCGCTLENKTLFPKILLLPGGSAWTFRNGESIRKDYYFKPSIWEGLPVLRKEAFYERLKETFRKILPRYFHSKHRIAMSLTGGLDTRMILACINQSSGELPCYTFGNASRETYDVQVAREAAEAFDQKYRVLQLDGNFFSDFQSLAERTIYITDGYLDVCGAHDLFLNRLAREIAPIRMTGKFGSEVLRNASTFKAVLPSDDLVHPDFMKYIRAGKEKLSEISNGHKLSFSVFKDAPWHEYGRLAIEQSQLVYRTPYMDNDLVGLFYQAPPAVRSSKEISLRLIKEMNPNLYRIMTDLGYGGESSYIYSKSFQLLRWFFFKTEWYYNEGMPHWLAKLEKVFSQFYTERLIFERHKFLHYRIWFRKELSDFLKEIILDKRTLTRPYLNGKFLEKMVQNHITGYGNYTNEINKTLTTELIQRALMEGLKS